MKRKIVLGLILTLLAISMLTLAFNIQHPEASGPIYIRADGSIDPPTANITSVDNVTYTFVGNISDPIVVERDNVIVDGAGYSVEGSGVGIGFSLFSISNVTIKNANIAGFSLGVRLNQAPNNTISGNNITNNGNGISIREYSHNNSIFGNNITANSDWGIYVEYSSNNSIHGNKIRENGNGGILLFGIKLTGYNIITGNEVIDNKYGIYFEGCSNNTLRDNNVANNMYGMYVWGQFLSEFMNDVDTSNLVNGKPVYYWINEQDLTVPLDAGYVALVNCTHITAQQLTLIKNGQGIVLAATTNSTITKNKMANNYIGISLFKSSNNSISESNITNNYYQGMYVYHSSNNTVSESNIADNNMYGIWLYRSLSTNITRNNITTNSDIGIWVYASSDSHIFGNNITNNNNGIKLEYSPQPFMNNNSIYHNNFLDNANQVYTYESANDWDDGYPSGGNYWNDYTDVDSFSGPNQNDPGSDGIWDHPYIIDENNVDRYPSTQQDGGIAPPPPPSVPEFPIGLAMEMLFIPVIIYIFWRSRQRKKEFP